MAKTKSTLSKIARRGSREQRVGLYGYPRPDVFASFVGAFRAMYQDEIERLADVYAERIIVGEFSGAPPQGDPRYMILEDDLAKTHPWVATQPGRLMVVACSRWLTKGYISGENGAVENLLGDCGAECMAADVLAVAAERGWVESYNDGENPYALRFARKVA